MRHVLVNHFIGPNIPFGAMVEYYPISSKDLSRSINLVRKYNPGIFLGYALVAGGIWKGDTVVADIEELGTLDASEIHARRFNAGEALTHKTVKNSYSHSQMEQQNCVGEIMKSENQLQGSYLVGREDLRGKFSRKLGLVSTKRST